jgi:hypothetical protein
VRATFARTAPRRSKISSEHRAPASGCTSPRGPARTQLNGPTEVRSGTVWLELDLLGREAVPILLGWATGCDSRRGQTRLCRLCEAGRSVQPSLWRSFSRADCSSSRRSREPCSGTPCASTQGPSPSSTPSPAGGPQRPPLGARRRGLDGQGGRTTRRSTAHREARRARGQGVGLGSGRARLVQEPLGLNAAVLQADDDPGFEPIRSSPVAHPIEEERSRRSSDQLKIDSLLLRLPATEVGGEVCPPATRQSRLRS